MQRSSEVVENPKIWPRGQGEVEERQKLCILNKKFQYLQRKVYEKKEKKALEVNVNNVLCSSDIGNTLKYSTYGPACCVHIRLKNITKKKSTVKIIKL